MSNGSYDGETFFVFWDTLKQTLLPGNIRGSGAGPLGRSSSVSGVIFSEDPGVFVPDPDTIDIGDGAHFITLNYATINGYSRGPMVEISARSRGETVLERTKIPLPDFVGDETNKERTVRWIEQILAVLQTAFDVTGYGVRLARWIESFLNPYLATIGIGGPPLADEPEWLMPEPQP